MPAGPPHRVALRRARLPALAVVVWAGCAGGDTPPPDAGDARPPDAVLIDGPVPDAWRDADGDGAADGAADAGRPACTRAECDPRVPTSCGDAGVCVLAGAEPVCIATAGDGRRGSICASSLDCAPGLACFLKRNGGRCHPVCCPDGDATTDGGAPSCPTAAPACNGLGLMPGAIWTDWGHCVAVRECDVFDPGAVCDPGQGCYILVEDGGTDCRRAGTLELGEACVGPSDCAPGLFCTGVGRQQCVRVCAVGAESGPGACPDAEGSCVQYAHTPSGLGLCTPLSAGGV